MNKIPTLFKRDFSNGGKIINETDEHVPVGFFDTLPIATEKLDGTNVRLTVRNHVLVRLEKRRNPTKLEKYKGIVDPWYVDAYETDPEDKYIWEAAKNTDLANVPDGEWSGEALGPKIQGNPLDLEKHWVYLFSCPTVTKYIFEEVPTTFEELKEWLPKQKSMVGKNGIEGIVWHNKRGLNAGQMVKIKTKDFEK